MKVGRIPGEMKAYLRPEQKQMMGDGNPHQEWSFPPDRRETPKFSMFDASPTFVVPSDSEAFNESAMQWATGFGEDGKIQKKKDVRIIEFPNDTITDLRWVGIDSRSEGGVAYKVLTPQGWLVDLREDVVIDCLFEGAIQSKKGPQGAGTYFTAEFVWAVMGSQSRLVRVGSKTCDEIMESICLRNVGPIKESLLEVGGIYQKSNGNVVVIIDKGTEKGRKFLTQEVSNHSTRTPEDRVSENLKALDIPSCMPYWHWMGSIKVHKQLGQIKLPSGLGKRFNDKVRQVQNSATAWNRLTSQ